MIPLDPLDAATMAAGRDAVPDIETLTPLIPSSALTELECAVGVRN